MDMPSTSPLMMVSRLWDGSLFNCFSFFSEPYQDILSHCGRTIKTNHQKTLDICLAPPLSWRQRQKGTTLVRSPSYPALSIGDAVARARQLWDKIGKNDAPVDTVLTHWGYKPNSGGAQTMLASLKKYGLIEYGRGADRRAHLTARAERIVRGRPDTPEWQQEVHDAALEPDIHKELWERLQKGADDDALKDFLKFDREFSDFAADRIVEQFHDTVTYAKLDSSDRMSEDVEDKTLADNLAPFGSFGGLTTLLDSPTKTTDEAPPESPAPGGAMRIPLVDNAFMDIRWSTKLSEKQWEQWQTVMEALKSGIVVADED